MSKKKTDYRKAGLVFEELEPRLLLSADPLAVATDASVAIVQELVPGENEDPTVIIQSSEVQAASSVRNELVIIDSRAPNYHQLHNDLIKAQQEGRNIHVLVLDAHRDGIEQINEALESHNKLDALHIVSHGDDGQLQLGATQLNKTTLQDRKADISNWKDTFTDGGDLLIYGCKLAETADGKSLVDSLSQLTATDVAASDDLTGNKLLGGDWELEYEAGDIETQVAFSDDVQQNWQGTLEGAAPAAQQEQPVEEQQQEQQAQVELTQQPAVINEEEQAATRQDEQEQQAVLTEEQRLEVVFIDESVDDYQSFIDDLQDNSNGSTSFEIILLNGDSSGIEQINDALADYNEVDALHILSHGDDGSVKLGNTWLNVSNIDQHGENLSAWGDALDQDGDILIYGCNLAESAIGEQFVTELAQLTGADVAASNDITGHTSLGGDWELEYKSGSVETSVALDTTTQSEYQGVLDTFVVSNTNATGIGSLHQAILDANANAGVTDTITFNIPGAVPHVINLTGALPTITDTIIIDGTTELDFSYAGDGSPRPVVVIDGSGAGAVNGIVLGAGSDGSEIRGLVIQNFQHNGIHVLSDSNTIAGNILGLQADGVTIAGNNWPAATIHRGNIRIDSANNIIGGLTPADRNIISGGGYAGIVLIGGGSTSNQVLGNYIGTDITGTLDRGNTQEGIEIDNANSNIIGGTVAGARNIISGNDSDGIEIDNGDNNIIQGNYIGTDVTGTLALGNLRDGIDLNDDAVAGSGSSGNLIGGTDPNAGNLISGNNLNGIEARDAMTNNNTMLGNRIYNNGGLGIELATSDPADVGVSSNDAGDADTGSNDQQNFPVLTSANTNMVDTIVINGTLNSNANSYFRIEIFSNSAGDASGYGEGENFLGFVNVATDAGGNGSFSATLSAAVANGAAISATATRSDITYTAFSDTSEFAANINAVANNAPTIWNYHHKVDLAAATAIADYPVEVQLVEGVNGFNHANAQASGEDIRFYDSAGNELNYWIEDWNDAGTSTIWVKVANAGTTTIEIFYGNSTVTSTSDPSATFLLYDDFEDGDSVGWTPVAGALTVTVPYVFNDTGNQVFSDGANNGGPVVDGGNWSDVAVSQDFRTINNGDIIDHAGLIARYEGVGDMVYGGIIDKDTAQIWYREAGAWTKIGGDWSITAHAVDDGNWHNQELRVHGDIVELYIDGTFIGNASVAGTGSAAGTSGQTGFWSQYGNREAYRDNHTVRSYDAGTGDIATTQRNEGFVLDESSANGSYVGYVIATDADVSDVLTYSITGGNTGGAFAINAGTGEITVNNSAALDFETNPVFNLTVQVADSVGATDTDNVAITLNDVNDVPVADAGGPYTINEGDALTLSAAASSDQDGDTLTYEWDINNDGTYGDVTGVGPTVDWATLQSFGIDDDGSYTIGLRVSDGNGGVSTTTTTLNVDNTAPTLSATGTGSVLEGASYTLNLSAVDPGDDTVSSWTINWGDGNIQTVAGNLSSVSHVYDEPGFTYNVTVSAVDEDGAFFDSALLVASAALGTDGYVLRYGYDPATGTADLSSIQVLNTTNPADLDWAGDVIVGPDGYIYVTGYQSNNVVRFDAGTGLQDGSFEISTSRPVSIAFGPDGNLYIASDTRVIKSYDVSNPSTMINSWTVSYTPEEMAFGPDGKLYLGDYVSPGRIYQHDITDPDWTDDAVFTTGMPAVSTRTEQFAFGPDGNLYVARLSGEILRFNGTTGAYMDIFAAPGKQGAGWPNGPTGVAFGPDGNLYVTRVDSVIRYDGTTGLYKDDFVPAGNGVVNPWFTTFMPNHQVTVQNSAPTLADGILTATFEDNANPAGESIATIFAGNFSDLNGSFNGVAVVGNPELAAEGSWQYSSDNGTTWYNIGTVADDATALVLDTSTLIRFLPALDFNGNPADLTVRALDNMYFSSYTNGATRVTVDASNNGNGTSVAAATTTVSTSITAVNDAPVIDLDANDSTASGQNFQTNFVEKNGPVFITDSDVSLIDVDFDDLNSITVSLVQDYDNNKESLGIDGVAPLPPGISVDTSDPLVLTISGTSSVADYLSVLSRVTYDNTAQNPDTTPRQITFVATDINAANSQVATTTVTVTQTFKPPINTVPAGPLTVAEDTPLAISGVDVRDNDNNLVSVALSVNNGTLNVTLQGGVTISAGSNDSGSLTLSGGTETEINDTLATLVYQGNLDYTGADSLTVLSTDALANIDTDTVAITVTPVNDAPVAIDDGLTTDEDTPLLITTAADLLVNDSDVELDALSITGFTQPVNGTVVDNADGTWTYTPDPDYNGNDSFTYTISDGNGGTDTATVTVTVNAINDAPLITSANTVSVAENQTSVLTVTYSDNDVPADAILYSIVGGADSALFSIDGSGNLSFNAAPDYENPGDADLGNDYVVQVQVDDQQGGTATQTITVNVTDANDAPVANDDNYSVDKDATLEVSTNWWDANWQYREQITFTNAPASTLTDFPVLIELTGGVNIDYSKLQNGGEDLRFIDADGVTVLDYQIEEWNTSGTSYVWVSVPQIDTTGTDYITMYYGNGSATDAQNANMVWDSNFVQVLHLNEDPTGAGVTISDSTSNGNNGVLQGTWDSSASVATQTGNGLYFDGNTSSRLIRVTDSASLDGTADGATISMWINFTNPVDGNHQNLMSSSNRFVGTDAGYELAVQGDGDLFFYPESDAGDNNYNLATDPFTAGQWHHIAVTMDWATKEVKMYVDGSPLAIAIENVPTEWLAAGLAQPEDWLWGGDPAQATRYFDGIYDEIRVSDSVHSADWIAAEYETGRNNFATFGSEEQKGDVLVNDTDAEGDSLTAVLLTGPSNATAFTLNADGSFTYTPNAGYVGTDTFTYKVNDGALDSNTATVTIDVTNTPPVATDDPGDYSTDLSALNPLSYWRFGESSGTTVSDMGSVSNSGNLNGVSLGQAGAINGDANTAISFNGSTDYIGVTDDAAYHIDEGSVQLWFNTNDVTTDQGIFSKDTSGTVSGGHFTILMDSSGTDGQIGTIGQIEVRLQSTTNSYYLTSGYGSISPGAWHHVVVNFGSGGMELFLDGVSVDTDPYTGGLGVSSGGVGNSEPIVIGANARQTSSPYTGLNQFFTGSIDEVAIIDQTLSADQVQKIYASAVQNYTVAEDSSLVISAAEGVLINDADAEGDVLTAALITGPTNGSLTLNTNGSFTYTPNLNFNGIDTFTYVANDGANDSNIATVTITVTGNNDAPTTASVTLLAIAEDSGARLITQAELLSNASDPEGDTLTATNLAISAGAGTLVNNFDGTWSYTPALNDDTSVSFSYTVSDGALTAAGSATLDITPANDAPVATANTNSIAEDAVSVSGNMLTDDDGFGIDSDLDGDTLTVTNVDATGADQYGSFTLDAPDGSYTYAVDNANAAVQALGVGQTLSEVYTYTVSDGQGGTDTATVIITITGTDDLPVAAADSAGILEDAVSVSGNVITNDTLGDGTVAENVITLNDPAVGSYGTIALGANGSYTYTLDNSNPLVQQLAPGDTLTETYDYTLTDKDGDTSVATLSITITGTNDGPTIGDVADIGFTEAADASAQNLSASGNVSFDDIDSTDVVDIDTALTTAATWSGGIIDAGLKTLLESGFSASVTDAPAPGTTPWSYSVLGADLDFLKAGETVTLTYTLTATDSAGATATDTVTITITGTNDAPVATANTNSIAEDAVSVSGNMLTDDDGAGIDSDIDGDTLTVSAVDTTGANLYGTLTLDNADGSYTYVVDNGNAAVQALGVGQTLSEVYTYTVSDGQGGNDTATVTITITGTNDAPVVSGASGTLPYTEGDGARVIDAALTISDVDDTNIESAIVFISGGFVGGEDVLAFTNTTNITGSFNAITGVLTLTGNDTLANYELALESITYTNTNTDNPNTGDRTITWMVSDGTANSAGMTSTITVAAVNDAPVVSSVGSALAYTEGDGAQVIDTALTISDVDDTNIESAIVFISGGFVGGEDVLAFTNTANITGSFNAVTGVLTLTGSDTLANYELALESITYTNTNNGNPNTGDRTITWMVNDGTSNSAGVASTITVAAINDAPTTSGVADVTVNEDAAASTIDLNAAFSDADNLDSELTYSIVGNTNIGLFSPAGIDGATGQLSLGYAADMNGSAQITIRAVDPSGLSVDTLFTVTVTPVNDTPVMQANSGILTTGAVPVTVTTNELNVTDVDNLNSEITYTLTALPGNGQLLLNGVALAVNDTFTQADLDNNRVVYQASGTAQADQFGFVVTDTAGGALPNDTFDIVVQLAQDNSNNTDTYVPSPQSDPEEETQGEVTEDSGDATDSAGGYGGGYVPVGTTATQQPPPAPVLTIEPAAMRAEKATQLVEKEVTEVKAPEVQTFTAVQLKSMDALWSAIDKMKQEMGESGDKMSSAEFKVTTAKSSGVVLTAGIVAWILRSGALLSSLMSTIPLWKGYDPLPILAYKDDKDEEEEEEGIHEDKIPTSLEELKKLKKLKESKNKGNDVESIFSGSAVRE